MDDTARRADSRTASLHGASTSWEVGFELIGTVSPGRVTECCKVLVDAELVEREDRDIGFGRFETYWSRSSVGDC